jgi:hypothetical protein
MSSTPDVRDKIGGLSVLKGTMLYGAILTFAGLYISFIVRVFEAVGGPPPKLDATQLSVAAALAGVLGSAFALEIGTPTDQDATNEELRKALKPDDDSLRHERLGAPASGVLTRAQRPAELQLAQDLRHLGLRDRGGGGRRVNSAYRRTRGTN